MREGTLIIPAATPAEAVIFFNQSNPMLEAQGNRAMIRRYCLSDVLTTALIYGRYAEHRGWWNAEQGQRFEGSVQDGLVAHANAYWQRYRAAWV